MNRSDCPENSDAEREAHDIWERVRQRAKATKVTGWDKANWTISLLLSTAGIVAAPVSGGLSLVLTLGGCFGLLLI